MPYRAHQVDLSALRDQSHDINTQQEEHSAGQAVMIFAYDVEVNGLPNQRRSCCLHKCGDNDQDKCEAKLQAEWGKIG